MSFVVDILIGFWKILCEMAPYLLFGFFVAGILSVFISASTVEKQLGGRGIWPVVKASLFGVPLPLCSCGVIPVTASLRKHGATRGAATSFLLSTPQTGVDSVMVTLGLLGPVFAIFRPLAAFITGVVGGSIVDLFAGSEDAGEDMPECHDACCCGGHDGSRLMRALRYGFVSLAREIGKPLIVGLLIAGLIGAVVPDDFFTETVGTGLGAMLLMMAFGIPLYVCATASVPIAAVMMLKGVSPGAALVFLMTGPATNAAAITTIWKIMGRRTAIIYLVTVAVSALASGYILNYVFYAGDFVSGEISMWMLPGWFKVISAIVLLVVLGNSLIRSSGTEHGSEEAHA